MDEVDKAGATGSRLVGQLRFDGELSPRLDRNGRATVRCPNRTAYRSGPL